MPLEGAEPVSEKGSGRATAITHEPIYLFSLPARAALDLEGYDDRAVLKFLERYSLTVSGRTKFQVEIEGEFRELKRFRSDFYAKMYPEIHTKGRGFDDKGKRECNTGSASRDWPRTAGGEDTKTRERQNTATEKSSRDPSNSHRKDRPSPSSTRDGKEFSSLSRDHRPPKREGPSSVRSPRHSPSPSKNKPQSSTGSLSASVVNDAESELSIDSRLAYKVSKLSVGSGIPDFSRKASSAFLEKRDPGPFPAAGLRRSSAPLELEPPTSPAALCESIAVDADVLRYVENFGKRYTEWCLKEYSVQIKTENCEDFSIVTLSVGDSRFSEDLADAFRYLSMLFGKYQKDLRIESIDLSDFAPERRGEIAEQIFHYGKTFNILVEGLKDRLRLVGLSADIIAFMQVWKAKERGYQIETQGLKQDKGSGPVPPNYPHPPSTRRKEPENDRRGSTSIDRSGTQRLHAPDVGDSDQPRGRTDRSTHRKPPSDRRPNRDHAQSKPDARGEK